ncbi:MAG TPA: hypothetical protein DEW39_00440 [Brevibacterium sp.]|nr:hypothetical protein [Brevibacterium sp.]
MKIGASSSFVASTGSVGSSVGSLVGIPDSVGSGVAGSVGSSDGDEGSSDGDEGSSDGDGDSLGPGATGSLGVLIGTPGVIGAEGFAPVSGPDEFGLSHPVFGVHSGAEAAVAEAVAPKVEATARASAARADAVRRLGAVMNPSLR